MNNQFTRRNAARKIREQAAELAFLRSHPDHPSNGEENDYPGYPRYIANYTKGLPHNDLGEVTPEAYQALLKAVNSGKPEDFEKIPLGCPAKNLSKLPKSEKDDDKPLPVMPCRKFTNPQAGLAFDLEGPDAQSLFIPPAPRIDSAQNSAEMAELLTVRSFG